MAKVWDKPITAETDWGGDASTDNLPVSGRQVQAWIKSNIKSDAQISQLLVSWLNTHTINSPVFWKGLPIDADTLSWDGDKLTVIGSDGESQPIDEQFLINFLQENGYLTKGDYPFVYDAEKKAWLFTGDLVATGAITMFGDFNKFKPSTIMDAVQVDDITIGKTTEGVLYAKSGGGSGGSGMSYEEINQIVSNAIQSKADKATTLEGYGIENAYDKSYIDTLAYKLTTVYNWGDHSKAGYVFKDTKQDISARHNFTNGIEIGGLAAYKSKDDVVFLDANLVVRGAITMYGDNGTTSKTIWENIPFDSTMQWNGSTWSVVGGGGSSINEDAVNLLIGEYLTNNNYASEQWVSNQGYAKQSSLDGVDNRLKSVETFFATSDTDNLVNKWSEIVTFLNATEGDTLDTILATKANKSTKISAGTGLSGGGDLSADITLSLATIGTAGTYTKVTTDAYGRVKSGASLAASDIPSLDWSKITSGKPTTISGYGITDAYTKAQIDTELAKYVKLATAQTISARHNFSDGLQIGGITIRKSQDGVVYIDGDLVIKGAMTMFGTDATIPSSIWANIPFNPEQMSWDGSQWNISGGGSGSVDDAKVNVLISEYLAKNSYATQTWVGDNYLAKSGGTLKGRVVINDATNTPLYLNSSIESNGIYFTLNTIQKSWIGYESSKGVVLYLQDGGHRLGINNAGEPFYDNYSLVHSNNIGSYNAGSATKLQTARTIWGQSFDGSGNASGQLYDISNQEFIYSSGTWTRVGNGTAKNGYPLYLDGNEIYLRYGVSQSYGLILHSNGNIVVGDTTADAQLHVHGNIMVNGEFYINNKTILRLDDSNTWVNYGGANDGLDLRLCGRELIFQYGRGDAFTRAMTITSGGNVVIGNVTNTVDRLLVEGNIRLTQYLKIQAWSGYGSGDCSMWYNGNTKTLEVDTGVSFSGNTTINGNLLTTGAITMFSQLSMKNVIDYNGLSLAQLAQIRPARFTWKDGRDSLVHAGGIADEVMQVLPEVVYRTKDDKLTMDYGSAAFYVGASLIKPVVELWEAKDKQQQEIESLKKRVEYLEKENRQLRA